jgi:hypothetical protein
MLVSDISLETNAYLLKTRLSVHTFTLFLMNKALYSLAPTVSFFKKKSIRTTQKVVFLFNNFMNCHVLLQIVVP